MVETPNEPVFRAQENNPIVEPAVAPINHNPEAPKPAQTQAPQVFDTRIGEYITREEAGKRCGVNPSRLSQLLEKGVVKKTEQGRYVWPHVKYDIEAARKQPYRATQVKPAGKVKRGPKPKQKGAPPAPEGTAPSTAPTNTPQPPSTVFDISLNIKSEDLVKPEPIELLIEAIRKGEEGALGVSYQYGRTMTELLGVREQQLKILKLEDTIIDRTLATDYVQKLFQHVRNVFLNLPERVATEFAEEAGIDRRLAFDLLSKYIHRALHECSTTEPELP